MIHLGSQLSQTFGVFVRCSRTNDAGTTKVIAPCSQFNLSFRLINREEVIWGIEAHLILITI